MTNRLSKWSRHSSRMLCLLAACGAMYACKDEFLLDDEKPTWLNASVYQSLQNDGNFKTYLKLLADKDVNPGNVRPLTDVLNRTGSKTVFVARDDAWEEFFKKNATLPESNPWHNATSYDKLSQAQKKLLIHTSMLNNSIVMENLASSEASGDASPVRGEYMRRETDVELTDTITYIPSQNLPYSYSPSDKDYWQRFREEKGGKGIHLIADATPSMMLHFTSEHLAKSTVTDKDFSIFMGRERITSDVHIYDAKLLEKDGVCENGYVNVTEKPLCPLSSMAEVIRVNGKTDIFSHMLDRYSAPFYDKAVSDAYNDLHPEFTDSIFVKKYFSDMSASLSATNREGSIKLNVEPADKGTTQPYMPYKESTSNKDIVPSLKFDPGWNGYWAEDAKYREKDMATMFVPSDEALWTYFTEGGGMQLINTYYVKEGTPEEIPYVKPTTKEELYQQIDYIPLGTLQSLINIIMLRSFTGSVPSKMTKLRDDAQEQLFYAHDIEKIDTCLLASNGAVYIMSDIYGPADYTSVTSPAYISTTNNIIKWAIYDEANMGLNYYAYLKAMQSKFTFFLPSDEALNYYYDPTSLKSRTPRVMTMSYKVQEFPVVARNYNYYGPYNADAENPTGTIGRPITGNGSSVQNADITNRLKDILESHTIVHDEFQPLDEMENEYFLSKNGNAIKVIRDENGNITGAMGGFQMENLRQGIDSLNPGVTECVVTKPFDGLKNGRTYVMNAPLVPTYRSVYSILTNDDDINKWDEETWAQNPYAEFYGLCTADAYERVIKGCGLVDERLSNSEQKSALKKYNIFINDNGLDYNVQFFNNYRYTAFIPTNEAVRAAFDAGLPTWEEIEADFNANRKPAWNEESGDYEYNADSTDYEYTDSLKTYEDSVRIAAKITYLTNFVRYHFADNSVFQDKSELADNEMVTSSYDKDLGLFCKIHVDRIKNGDSSTLRVCDDVTWKKNKDNKMPIVGEPNVMARDVTCSIRPVGVIMTGVRLNASSAAVIHQIDGILNHTELVDGRHDSTWATPASAKKYLQRYAIQDK